MSQSCQQAHQIRGIGRRTNHGPFGRIEGPDGAGLAGLPARSGIRAGN